MSDQEGDVNLLESHLNNFLIFAARKCEKVHLFQTHPRWPNTRGDLAHNHASLRRRHSKPIAWDHRKKKVLGGALARQFLASVVAIHYKSPDVVVFVKWFKLKGIGKTRYLEERRILERSVFPSLTWSLEIHSRMLFSVARLEKNDLLRVLGSFWLCSKSLYTFEIYIQTHSREWWLLPLA